MSTTPRDSFLRYDHPQQYFYTFSAKGDSMLSLRYALQSPYSLAGPVSFSPDCCSFIDASGPERWNYVAWNTAFCAYPRLLTAKLNPGEYPQKSLFAMETQTGDIHSGLFRIV
jgi:hypothetical protein